MSDTPADRVLTPAERAAVERLYRDERLGLADALRRVLGDVEPDTTLRVNLDLRRNP